MWKLVIEDDEGKRTVVPLTRDDYTLGRREGNTIRLTERNVSRDHALLRKKVAGNGSGSAASSSTPSANSFTLHDCSSYNGVYVNGVRVVDGHDLQHGDLIQIGDYRLILQDDSISDQPSAVGLTAEDGKTTLPLGVTRGSLLLERPNRMVMLAGPTPGAEYPLTMERMTLGRAEDATISINHNSVSRLHCEVHALGESRFEIVDKGSSNGVRVNGSDLRRGIIEAGDIIELGDVRFKFVGAGQVFVPGVTESAQLEAISDRSASAALRRSGTSPKAVWFFALSVAALVGAGAFVVLRRSSATVEPAPSAQITSESSEALVMSEAKRLCASGDCERAHDRLAAGIALASPMRDSDDFKMIAGTHWDRQLAKAQTETDLPRRRALLETISKASTIDSTRRNVALERLHAIEQGAVAAPTGNGGLATPGNTSTVTAVAPTRDATPAPAPKPPRDPHPAPAPKPPVASGGGSVLEKARSIMLNDQQGAKAMLMPRVAGGKATREEIELLRTVCRELRDSVCVTMCNDKLKAPP